jgi:type I restriction enzyme, S subunit
LGSLAIIGTGSTPSRGEPSFWTGGSVPWTTSTAVNAPVVTQPSELITGEAVDAAHLATYPKGTLLLAMYGEGKTRGKVTELAIDSTINQALAAIVMEGESASCLPYVKLFLESNYEDMRKAAVGGVQPNLNLAIVSQIAIPFPPLSEQVAIMWEVERTLSVHEQLDDLGERSYKRASRLRQSILHHAFEGKLVPQDPTDEPASVLLERIKDERRAAAEAKPATRRRRKPKSTVAKGYQLIPLPLDTTDQD